MSLERDIIRAWAVRLRLGLGLGLGKSGKRKDGLRGVENSVGTRSVASMAPAERGPTDVTIQNQKMGSEVEKIGVRGRKRWGQRSKKLGSEAESGRGKRQGGLGLGKSGRRKDGLRGVENSVGTRFGPLEPAPAHSEFCLRQYWTARCAGIVASMAPAERGPTEFTIQNQKLGSEAAKCFYAKGSKVKSFSVRVLCWRTLLLNKRIVLMVKDLG